ncbi:MAG: DinB family protein [Anaerolineales bacterium]
MEGKITKAEKLLDHWDRVRNGLLETIDGFTEADLEFKAFEGAYDVRQLILHIAHEEYGEIQYGLTGSLAEFPPPFQDEDYPTLASARAKLASTHGQTRLYLGTIDDNALEADFVAPWGETKPLMDYILHVIEHEIHHRGELSLILGLLGKKGLDA